MSRLAICALAAFVLSSCTSLDTGGYKDKRLPVKGTVTLDGKPLDNGTITFFATTEGQRQSGGPIVNGTYDVPEGQGPNAGKYRVEIRSQKPTGKKVKDSDTGEMIDVMAEALPAKYHNKSAVTVTFEEGKTDYPFELQSN